MNLRSATLQGLSHYSIKLLVLVVLFVGNNNRGGGGVTCFLLYIDKVENLNINTNVCMYMFAFIPCFQENNGTLAIL